MIRKIETEYLSAFLGFAINRTGNTAEAEELAQEIAYQCLLAIAKNNIRDNFDGYVWSIAHNTFKRSCKAKSVYSLDGDNDTFTNIVSDDMPVDEQIIDCEEVNRIRLALSRLSADYRKTAVCFYYEEMTIKDIGKRMSLSEGMVKFYLRAGRQKLKETFYMEQTGEKSFNPSEFSIYKSAIDFSKVDVWDVFKRKLPAQIAIICHDGAKTVSEISIETGTPAVYIEDEVELLLKAGVMINPVKDKYRTNFHILKKNAAAQIKDQFAKLYKEYIPSMLAAYEKYLPSLKECDVFRFDASDNQWAWFFSDNIESFDFTGIYLSNNDYPEILSCGSKAFIFAEESKGSLFAAGHTPTYLEKCTVWPCDVMAFGEYHRQKELRDPRKAQALYDVYCGNIKSDDEEIYAELIKQGYVIKNDEKLLCNVAVSTVKSRSLFKTINAELKEKLIPLCANIREGIDRVVKATLPEQLKQYGKGYTSTWINFYSGVYLYEALYENGFLRVPEKDDMTPVASWIYEK